MLLIEHAYADHMGTDELTAGVADHVRDDVGIDTPLFDPGGRRRRVG